MITTDAGTSWQNCSASFGGNTRFAECDLQNATTGIIRIGNYNSVKGTGAASERDDIENFGMCVGASTTDVTPGAEIICREATPDDICDGTSNHHYLSEYTIFTVGHTDTVNQGTILIHVVDEGHADAGTNQPDTNCNAY